MASTMRPAKVRGCGRPSAMTRLTLPPSRFVDVLAAYFQRFGDVQSAEIMLNHTTSRSRGVRVGGGERKG